jgi:hypothetical protein
MEEGKPSDWQTIEPNVAKLENKGDSVEGILIEKREGVGKYSSSAYMLEAEEQKQLLVWGSTLLDDRMKFVKVGEQVRITFIERVENKRGQPIKIFKVERKQI